MEIIIVKGSFSELEDIVRFQIEMAMESEGCVLDPGKVRSGVEGALKDPSRGEYFVAKDEAGITLGSLMVTKEWSDWNSCYYWWIQSVYVRPGSRGAGVFRALYDEVRRCAKESGSTSLRLYADKDNLNAQAVYEKLGMDRSHYLMFEEKL